jgi:hypothetical protein
LHSSCSTWGITASDASGLAVSSLPSLLSFPRGELEPFVSEQQRWVDAQLSRAEKFLSLFRLKKLQTKTFT